MSVTRTCPRQISLRNEFLEIESLKRLVGVRKWELNFGDQPCGGPLDLHAIMECCLPRQCSSNINISHAARMKNARAPAQIAFVFSDGIMSDLLVGVHLHW